MTSTTTRPRTDILFITHLTVPRGTGDLRVYDPLRLKLGEHVATIPVLQAAAGNSGVRESLARLMETFAERGGPPVLTPFFLADYMRRRGLVFEEVPCLETGQRQIEDALGRGVGLMALSTTWLPGSGDAGRIRDAAAKLRKMAPGVPIVAGGVGVRKGLRSRQLLAENKMPHVSAAELAEHYLLLDAALDKDVDAVIVSEGGEATLAAIATRIREHRDFLDLPNLAFPREGAYRFTDTAPEVSDLDGEIVDWRNCVGRLGGLEAPIRTAVGCPFRCGFCDFASLYKPGLRSVESLLREIGTLAETGPGPHRVFFTDDNIAIHRKRLLDFTRALVETKVNLAWRAFVRADAVDAETAALMRDSGCRECLLGIESGDPVVLRNMRKRLDPDTALNAVRLLDANGVNTQCSFVVGFPGENARSIRNTAALISAFPSGEGAGAIHRYFLFCFQVLPLSPVAGPEQRREFGLSGLGETWAHDTMNSEEAVAATRDIFTKVRGPTHMYLEFVPPHWPVSATRRVMELRDEIQKKGLAGSGGPDDVNELLGAVRTTDALSGATPVP